MVKRLMKYMAMPMRMYASLLIIALSRRSLKAAKGFTFLTSLITSGYVLFSSTLVPLDILRSLLALSIPLSLASKLPQIAKIQSSGSTGQLSAFLVFSSLAGTLGRLFTTATETGDRTLWWSFVSASVLNAVLAGQMLYYWRDTTSGRGTKVDKVASEKREEQKSGTGNAGQGTRSNATGSAGLTPSKLSGNVASPSPRAGAGRPATRAASTRYTRKVD